MASKVGAEKAAQRIFYVYEHWRPDKNECFWVGKGHADRAYDMRRNAHHRNITKKLTRLGMAVEIRIIEHGMTESEALAREIHWIAYWRADGVKLANITDGGEGVCGLKHSVETRAILSAKTTANRTGKSIAPETRAKISAANKEAHAYRRGVKNPAHSDKMRGRKHSEAHKKLISDGLKGRVVSDETRHKIAASNAGQKRSDEARKNMSASHIGTKHSDAHRLAQSEAQKRRWALRREAEQCQRS